MIATLPADNTFNARNYGVDKETVKCWIGIGVGRSRSDVKPCVTVRAYAGRSRNASRIYASVWIGRDNASFSGTGYASGGGYHMVSAAVDSAIRSAGITLSEDIDGRGDSAIKDAVIALVLALGYDTARCVEAV